VLIIAKCDSTNCCRASISGCHIKSLLSSGEIYRQSLTIKDKTHQITASLERTHHAMLQHEIFRANDTQQLDTTAWPRKCRTISLL